MTRDEAIRIARLRKKLLVKIILGLAEKAEENEGRRADSGSGTPSGMKPP